MFPMMPPVAFSVDANATFRENRLSDIVTKPRNLFPSKIAFAFIFKRARNLLRKENIFLFFRTP